tara:strand:- start:10043 stop:10354 length:312 start_codon:yes stop_codon:yes gene_type:complete
MSQNKIYVGNLAYSVTQADLEDFFNKFGAVTEAKLITDFETGRSKGFAFIEFETQSAAQDSLEGNGQELAGRSLKVSMARENKGKGGSRSGGGYRDNNRDYYG